MDKRLPLYVSFLAITAMVLISAWGWMIIPAGARIAVHWGVNGAPNGFASKERALLILPVVAVALTALFALIPSIEPRRANLLASRKLYLAGWYGSLFILVGAHSVVVLTAAGWHVDIRRWGSAIVALLMIVLGNFLGKSRSTFFVGLRLPWTLSSELAWSKSNRIAGLGLVATGLATLIALAFASASVVLLVLLIGVTLSAVIAGVASFFYWKHDDNKFNGGSVHE
jgi:uncharacterized membrane protein